MYNTHMLWIVLALFAPILWAASNLIDSRIVVKHKLNPLGFCALSGLFGIFPLAYFILAGTPFKFNWPIVALGIFTGTTALFAYYPYFKALEKAHPATALFLWNLSPALIAVLAYVILRERLSAFDYVAVALLIGSALIADIHKLKKTGSGARDYLLMSLASVLTAAEALSLKALTGMTSAANAMILLYGSGVVLSLIILAVHVKTRRNLMARIKTKSFTLAADEGLTLAGGLCSNFAVALGPVSLVKAIGGIQPLLIILLGEMFSDSLDKQTRSNRPGWLPALLATALSVLGLLLIRE